MSTTRVHPGAVIWPRDPRADPSCRRRPRRRTRRRSTKRSTSAPTPTSSISSIPSRPSGHSSCSPTATTRPAERWTQHRQVDADDQPHHPVEPAHLLLARLSINRGQGAQVLPLLDRLLSAATADRRTGSVIEIEMLRALALADDDPSRPPCRRSLGGRARRTAALRPRLRGRRRTDGRSDRRG